MEIVPLMVLVELTLDIANPVKECNLGNVPGVLWVKVVLARDLCQKIEWSNALN